MKTLCHLNDIEEGRAKGFELNGKHLFAVKKDNQLHLYYNYCPHLGTPLEWLEDQFLDPDGTFIQCANVFRDPAAAKHCGPFRLSWAMVL